MSSPCINCVAPKRYPGCHSACPDYISEKQKREEIKKRIREEKINTYSICEGVDRMNKKRGKKKKQF